MLTFPDELWGNITDSGKDLVNRMLDKNQETRLTVKQIKNHPWFKSMLPKNGIIIHKKPLIVAAIN